MNVIVHYPKSQNDIEKLSKKVSEVHITFITDYLRQHKYSDEKTRFLINMISSKITQQ